jgi:hypothetical protein
VVLKFGNGHCNIVHDVGIGLIGKSLKGTAPDIELGQGTLELLLADVMEYDFEMGEGNADPVQCDGHQN